MSSGLKIQRRKEIRPGVDIVNCLLQVAPVQKGPRTWVKKHGPPPGANAQPMGYTGAPSPTYPSMGAQGGKNKDGWV